MKKETWRLIETGFHDAYFNMAVDEVLLIEKEKDNIPSTIRFYGWEPAAFSLGYIQKIEEEIKLEILEKLGIGCVSRVTGGGIIFHHQEVTYSLAIGLDSYLFSNKVGDSFRQLCRGIIKMIELLGVKARFAQDSKELTVRNSAPFCFTANSSYDIIIGNKKLGGNAQRRKKKVILQHGSIPLELNLGPFLGALTNFSGEDIQATCLKDVLNRTLTFEEASAFLKAGFKEGLNIELEPGRLSREELKIVEILAREKREAFLKLTKGSDA